MSRNYYETDRALSEYLLFHYGPPEEMRPAGMDLSGAANFHERCVAECVDRKRLPAGGRALDLGCSVGRATFEIARHCAEVLGIDYSERFITIANHLRENGSLLFGCIDEGDLTHPCQAMVPSAIDRGRVRFERGDAMNLPLDLGTFDLVLMANLIDRLGDPSRCLERLPALLKGGGQLVIVSPYSWLTDFTPRNNWLGGLEMYGRRITTLQTLRSVLEPRFQFERCLDLPFLIREHARKFQYCVPEASIWTRL
jgi:putative 4-mercaptohistidine N1-methyltranferase